MEKRDKYDYDILAALRGIDKSLKKIALILDAIGYCERSFKSDYLKDAVVKDPSKFRDKEYYTQSPWPDIVGDLRQTKTGGNTDEQNNED